MSRIEPNPFIELKDIQVNPEHWTQKISLIEFKDKKGKTYWTKDYPFIPNWKRYKEAKDWIKNTEFPEYDCKVVWNDNDGIEIVTQNYFGGTIAFEQNINRVLGKIQRKIIKAINELDLNKEKDLKVGQELEDVLEYTKNRDLLEDIISRGSRHLSVSSVLNRKYRKFWNHRHIYKEELEQLKQTESKKGKLSGKDLEKQAYDLNRTDLAILWRKQLYFVDVWKYNDNYNLYVQFKARKCPLSISYPTWLSRSGVGVLEQGPVVKDYSDKPILDKKGRKLLVGHRFHYDFCQDLGIKKVWQQPMLSYQPKFAFFYIDKAGIRGINLVKKDSLIFPMDVKLIKLPMDVKPEDFRRKADLAKLQNILSSIPRSGPNPFAFISGVISQLLKDHYYFTIGPSEKTENDKSGLWNSSFEKEEILFSKKDGTSDAEMERMFLEQPHLWDHTTFQFFLFNNITMTANGRYLGIVEKDGKFILPYKLFINFSPGNLYYRWEFEYITVKCEISIGFEFRDSSNPVSLLTGTHIRIATFGGGVDWNPNNIPKYEDNLKKAKKAAAKQQAQIDKTIKDGYKETLNRTIEPAMYNANTRDFNYSIGEFYNRFSNPVFTIRMNISELLYNNLTWANNKSTTLSLPFSWKELGSWTQKEGFYKWREVYLEEDYQGFWKERMEGGYFLTSGEELVNPKLSYHRTKSYIVLGDNSWSVNFAEEEIIEKEVVEEYEEKLEGGGFNKSDAHVSFVTYFRTDDNNLYSQIATKLTQHNTGVGRTVRQASYTPNNNSIDNVNVFCWGCVIRDVEVPISQGGTIYTFFNQNQGAEEVMEIPDDCILIIDTTRGEFRVKGKRVRKEYSTQMNPSTQTATQEIDQDLLESENFEAEEITVENEDASEILKETGASQEKENIEPEKEDEQEKDKETEEEDEQEQERETEREKERERETETEKEKEKEREKEKAEAERKEWERQEQERIERERENENE